MELIESSETSAYINTLTPGTYPKEKKLQSKHGESLKSRITNKWFAVNIMSKLHYKNPIFVMHGATGVRSLRTIGLVSFCD